MKLIFLLTFIFVSSFCFQSFAQNTPEQANRGEEHRNETHLSAQSAGDCNSISDIELTDHTAYVSVTAPNTDRRRQGSEGQN